METSTNNNVNTNQVSTAKTVANTAKNAALYSTEKPLVGIAIIMRSAAAVLGSVGNMSMKGAVELHKIRKDEASAKSMVSGIDNGFATIEESIDAKVKFMQDKVAKLQAERANKKRMAQVKADEKALEAAMKLVAEHKANLSEAKIIVDGPLR